MSFLQRIPDRTGCTMCSVRAGEALEGCVGPVSSAGQFDYKCREAGIPAPLRHNQEISHHHHQAFRNKFHTSHSKKIGNKMKQSKGKIFNMN